MIDIGLGFALVTLSTLCTAIFVGLGFLARPARSALMWSFTFIIASVSSYGWLASDSLDSHSLRAFYAGLMLGATSFVWLGLRARRDADRFHWVIALLFTITAPLLLAVTVANDFYGLIFRLAFGGGAVFGALTLVELVRIRRHARDVTLPLMFASGAFVVFGVALLVDGAIRYSAGMPLVAPDGLGLVRDVNSLFSLVFLICALVTLLFLARQSPVGEPTRAQSPFRLVAEDRLARALAADDQWWSVLDIRLDDPVDLREAMSPDAYERITARFADDVRASLPPDADIERRGSTGFVALLPRPAGGVRQALARLLERVALPDPDGSIPVRISVSIGWATAETAGHDLDDLLAAAAAAATKAQQTGGDRWEPAAPVDG